MKELIIDTIPFFYKNTSLNESIDDSKPMRISGILQRANAKNQNGRIYPWETLLREVTKYDTDFVKHNRAVGCLDHEETAVVELKNVSHHIIEMHWNDKELIGTLEILPTPNGNILKNLVKAGILIGVSSRGTGSVKRSLKEDANIVQEDFQLVCFDVVSLPSTYGSFLRSENSSLNESIEVLKKKVDPIYMEIDNIIHNIIKHI